MEREALAQAQARFLSLYSKAERGTSLKLFCEENPDGPKYHTVQAWGRKDEVFKAALDKTRHKVCKFGKMRRPPGGEDGEMAAPVLMERIVKVPMVAKEADAEPAAPLSDAQLRFLTYYEETRFDVMASCKESGLPYQEYEKLRVADGPFKAQYDTLERMKKQALEDQLVRQCLVDGDKSSLLKVLAALQSNLVLPTNGDDSGGLNLMTAGLAGKRRFWRDHLRSETVVQQASETLQ